MAIDRVTIDRLFLQLNDYLDRIERMDFTLEEIVKNKDVQDIIARRLQVAVEICIDIAMHLASGLNLPAKDTAVDVFELLGKEKVISEDLTDRMAEATRFRNLLVHGYAKIKYRKIFRNYQDDLQDLRGFAKAVVEFLEKNPKV